MAGAVSKLVHQNGLSTRIYQSKHNSENGTSDIENKNVDEFVAIKVFSKKNNDDISTIHNEYNILHQQLSNVPNVSKVIKKDENSNTVAMYFNWIRGMTLNQYLIKNRHSWNDRSIKVNDILTRTRIVYEIVKTFRSIHEVCVVHNDVTSENIMIHHSLEENENEGNKGTPDELEVTVISFGLASCIQSIEIADEGMRANDDIHPLKTLIMNIFQMEEEEYKGEEIKTKEDSVGFVKNDIINMTTTTLSTSSAKMTTSDTFCHLANDFGAGQVYSNSLFPKMLPRSLQRILRDLMEGSDDDFEGKSMTTNRDSNPNLPKPYISLLELEEDLHQLISKPETFLFDSSEIEYDSTDAIFKSNRIPKVLHGREDDLETLIACCERVCHVKNETSLREKSYDLTDDEDGKLGNIVFISGPSGCGKSALVQKAHEEFLRMQEEEEEGICSGCGKFIIGKFDQLQATEPYSALIGALDQLCESFLSDPKRNKIKQKILHALGTNGRVLTNVLPKLQELIGVQPPLPELDDILKDQHRFKHTFQCFFKSLCGSEREEGEKEEEEKEEDEEKEENALVLVLDDLQWADNASLDLIFNLVGDGDNTLKKRSHNLLFVGCYRDEEITTDHILSEKIMELKRKKVPMTNIHLSNMKVSSVHNFLSERLRLTKRHTQNMSEIIHCKTLGNPFFINQFLQSLCDGKELQFSFETMRWEWNDSEVAEQCIVGDGIVELMGMKIQSLEEDIQKILKLCSCVGSYFEESVIKLLWPITTSFSSNGNKKNIEIKEEMSIDKMLRKLVKEGLIVKRKNSTTNNCQYRFSHDRIQQVAYSLISQDEKGFVHLHIGRTYLAQTVIPNNITTKKIITCNTINFDNTPSSSLSLSSSTLFAAIEQLNRGAEFMTNQTEVLNLIQLNIQAAEKAMQSSAFLPAKTYIETSLQLFDIVASFDNKKKEDEEQKKIYCWTKHYETTLKIYYLLAEVHYCQQGNQFSVTEQVIDTIFLHAQTFRDKIPAIITLIKTLGINGRATEALNLGLDLLRQIGEPLPRSASVPVILMELMKTKMALRGKSDEYFLSLPLMKDKKKLMASEILKQVGGFAYLTGSPYFVLVVLRGVQDTAQYGVSKYTIFSFALFGIILLNIFGDCDSAHRYGKLSEMMLQRFNDRSSNAKVNVVYYGLIHHFRNHMRLSLDPLDQTMNLGLSAGDKEYAVYGAAVHVRIAFVSGQINLQTLADKINSYCQAAADLGQETGRDCLVVVFGTVLHLIGRSSKGNPLELTYDNMNEEEFLKRMMDTNHLGAIYKVHSHVAYLAYLFGKYEIAAERSRKISDDIASVLSGGIEIGMHIFYDGMSSFELARECGHNNCPIKQSRWKRRGRKKMKVMKKMAKNAPSNYTHKSLLLQAENAAMCSSNMKKQKFAKKAYGLAIAAAKENGFIQDEALAYERTSVFHQNLGEEQSAADCQAKAYDLFMTWGAYAKARELSHRYSSLAQKSKIE